MGRDAKRLLVIGQSGQLARSIVKIAPHFPQLQISYSDRAELDLSSASSIQHYFSQHRYDSIINSAAYTAVDQAESESELADRVNHQAVGELAEIAKQQQSALIHLSTDYVFDGTQNIPYQESDMTNPVSIYGSSKLKGEQALQQVAPNGCIVRTSWLYSEFGSNFVETMLKLGRERDQLNIVYDQIGSPTYATNLAQALLGIAISDSVYRSSEEIPIYHYANQGVGSWYDFATAIFELTEMGCMIHPITSAQHPTPAKRPHYSVLSTEKIKQQFQLSIPYWRDALKQCLEEIEKHERNDV